MMETYKDFTQFDGQGGWFFHFCACRTLFVKMKCVCSAILYTTLVLVRKTTAVSSYQGYVVMECENIMIV